MDRTQDYLTKHAVLERDNYKCVLCSAKPVQVHEIVPRSRFGRLQQDLLFHPKNRACLCQLCHSAAHTLPERIRLLTYLQKKYKYTYNEPEFAQYFNQ